MVTALTEFLCIGYIATALHPWCESPPQNAALIYRNPSHPSLWMPTKLRMPVVHSAQWCSVHSDQKYKFIHWLSSNTWHWFLCCHSKQMTKCYCLQLTAASLTFSTILPMSNIFQIRIPLDVSWAHTHAVGLHWPPLGQEAEEVGRYGATSPPCCSTHKSSLTFPSPRYG